MIDNNTDIQHSASPNQIQEKPESQQLPPKIIDTTPILKEVQDNKTTRGIYQQPFTGEQITPQPILAQDREQEILNEIGFISNGTGLKKINCFDIVAILCSLGNTMTIDSFNNLLNKSDIFQRVLSDYNKRILNNYIKELFILLDNKSIYLIFSFKYRFS